jgi:hypothetical protein
MSSWNQPSRTRGGVKTTTPEAITWRERVLAALVASVVFNLSTFLLLAVFLRGVRGIPGTTFLPPIALVATLTVVPAIAGFCLGFTRLVPLLGHTFYTNPESERDLRITVAIWLAFAVCTYLVGVLAT